MSAGAAAAEVRRADAADEGQILALARRTLGWDDDPRFAELFRWKHDRGPFGPSPRWVAVEDGRVIGFRVFLRWQFRTPTGATLTAVRAVDTATDPDHQGKGIFTRLTLGALEQLAADGVDFVFNTPNEKSRPGYLKMGWVELGRPGVGVAPSPLALPRVARARLPAELWSEPCTAGVAAPELLADPRAAGRPGLADRTTTDATTEFLTWRYGLDGLHYRALALGRDPAEGHAVFRLRRRGPSLEAAVGELEAPSARARHRLLRLVRRRSGADHLLVRSTVRLDPTPLVQIPSLAPIVTWRAVNQTVAPTLDELALTVGDLELF